MHLSLSALVASSMAVLAAGRAYHHANARVEQQSLTNGYYFHTQIRQNNLDSILFALNFSGGSMWAAALFFGLLEEGIKAQQ